jgi:hypothetical protein
LHYTAQWDTVSSIKYERTDEYFDVCVPDAEHYYAEGFWHHNTGKTWATLWLLDSLLRETPKAQAGLLRKVAADIGPTVLVTYRRIIERSNSGATPFGGEKPEWFDYPNGARLYVGGMDRPGKVLSGERDFLYVNQAEELTQEDWEILSTRTTGRGAVTKHQCFRRLQSRPRRPLDSQARIIKSFSLETRR